MTTAMKAKKELLASQVSNLVSDTNENLLRVNLSKFFTDLEAEIQKALIEYWNDTLLLQGQINLILSPIHEKHQEYYELIMTHKLQEFRRAQKLGERLVKREQEKVAMKAAQPVKFIHNEDNLFGTLEYTEERLSDYTFTASQNTLNRVDGNINEILTTGYREGKGINEVSRKITERFDQLRTWEAKRIARTEIHTSQNMGIMNSYESLGVEYTQWSAAHDSRTRRSHIEIDGEIIPFGGTYSNKLRFPGDTSGPIEEWINCRCANAPFVLPAGMMAPTFSPFREEDLIPIDSTVQPTTSEPTTSIDNNPIPSNIQSEMNKFGKQYEYSSNEHIQFFTEAETSEIAHGMRGNVNLTGKQRQFLNEKAKTGEEVHALHNHPTDETRKEGYTMFSDTDVHTFVTWNIRGGTREIPINMKTSSAENQFNRITIERLDNFYDIYKKGIRSEESLGRGTSHAISRAFLKQEQFYEKYHPTVTKGMQYLREVKSTLREQGLSPTEINQQIGSYEKKAEQIDKEWFEERQREFPKLVEEMNKELNPYGLHISSEYKVGPYANAVNTSTRPKTKSAPKTNKPKVSQEEIEQLEFLKEQYEMAKQDLKRLSKDDPMYKSIQKMAINNRKKIKELEKKLK